MYRLRSIVILLITFLVTITLLSCRKDSEEETVRNIIIGIQKAAEEKNTSAIMQHVSVSYSDPQGMTHDALKRMLRGYFLVYPKISVYLNYLQVNVTGASASAKFQTLLTSGQKKGSVADIIPQSLGVYRFDVSLAKVSGKWRIVSASWESVNNDSDAGE